MAADLIIRYSVLNPVLPWMNVSFHRFGSTLKMYKNSELAEVWIDVQCTTLLSELFIYFMLCMLTWAKFVGFHNIFFFFFKFCKYR